MSTMSPLTGHPVVLVGGEHDGEKWTLKPSFFDSGFVVFEETDSTFLAIERDDRFHPRPEQVVYVIYEGMQDFFAGYHPAILQSLGKPELLNHKRVGPAGWEGMIKNQQVMDVLKAGFATNAEKTLNVRIIGSILTEIEKDSYTFRALALPNV